jgi:alkylation response protein AidB-like acyl-CoA dehydrogenase
VNFAFSDEQEELRGTIRKFLEAKVPSSEVRRIMDTDEGSDELLWKQMSEELALPGMHVPEEYGGQGFTFVELGIVLQEMGRALAPSPYFATVCLAANAILNAGTEEQKRELLPAIAAGQRPATLAVAEPSGRWDAEGIAAEAVPDGDRFRLTGTKTYVIDGHTASLLVVAARAPGTTGQDGVGLFLVDGDADGVTRTKLDTIDQTRKQARVELANVSATPLGDPGTTAWPALRTTLRQISVCLSTEATGGAERCLDLAVDYAKNRVQFGRPIGAFQAVKHICANMLIDVESARTAAYYALWAAAEDGDELAIAAPMAKAFCTEAFFRCATSNHQVHGGIGFTWEHDSHLYFRRAKSSELLFGDPTYHRELLATAVGI